MARSRDNGGGIPVTTYEVCEYDAEAMTPASTYGALRRAMRAGLAGGCRGLWFPTNRAWEMRKALEERFLAEVDL
jgi:hypothetical protein